MKCLFIPHTHWDREWYLPFNEYRLYLVKVLDRVLDSLEKGDLEYFLLDGQVSALLDYLEVRPEYTDRVKKLISDGKLSIGPWFTQPDEFLVSGEALIRNLLIGIKLAESYGGSLRIGYLPDIFGHTPQLPQILNGFGIDTFLFSRGMDDRVPCEFIWEAPDGSRVYASFLKLGYCNAYFLGVRNPYREYLRILISPYGRLSAYYTFYDEEPDPDLEEAINRVQEIVKEMKNCQLSNTVLLMNGCDHLPVQVKIKKILEEIQNRLGLKVSIGGLEEYFESLKKLHADLKIYRGEMRSAKYRPILADILSTRVYLKQLNFKAQKLLEKYLEPICSFLIMLDDDYPTNLIEILWRNLLLNHAHDSICGTSVDEVHRENVVRFQEVISAASNMFLQKMLKLANMTPGENKIVVFNPNNWETTSVVEAVIPTKIEIEGIVDHRGKVYPVQIIKTNDFFGKTRKIVFIAKNVPPLGYSTYYLSTRRENSSDLKVLGDNIIENEYLRIEINPEKGATISVTDKVSGKIYNNLNLLVDEGDAGDVYNYDKPDEDIVISSDNYKAQLQVPERGPVKATIKAELTMRVPTCVKNRKRTKELTDLKVKILYTLYSRIPRIDVKVVVHNTAKDHRLRAVFPLKIKTDKVISEVHYYHYERPIEIKEEKDWVEIPPKVHPMHDFIAIAEKNHGILISTRGLYEYSAENTRDGLNVYITLFRSTGMLSKEDLKSRKGHAGPPIPVPEAQCLGILEFEYSIIPFGSNLFDAIKLAKEFTQPLASVYSHYGDSSIPSSNSFVSVYPDDLIISAIKKHSNDDKLVIRLYNPTGETKKAELRCFRKIKSAFEANLLEEYIKDVSITDDYTITFTMEPYKIKTVILEVE